MSTYTARKNAVLKSSLSYAKLLSTSALTAASLVALSGSPVLAGDGPVGDHDVMVLENTAASSQSLGFVEYEDAVRIVDNALQEDIGRLGHTHFNTPLAVITGVEQGPMQILGKLTSTGDLYVLDVDGFLFGNGSVVDTVGHFGAGTGNTTLDGDNTIFSSPTIGSEIMALGTIEAGGAVILHAEKITNEGVIIAKGGQLIAAAADQITLRLNDPQGRIDIENVLEDGVIINTGRMSVKNAGISALVAPQVSNSGVINAKMGTVALAAGETVTLDLYGDGLVEIAVEGDLAEALVENSGKIKAKGGTVQMTALAAKQAVDNIINVEGIEVAAAAEVQGGKIVLSGGKIVADEIKLESDRVDIEQDVLVRDGTFDVDTEIVNLNGRLYDVDGSTALDYARLSSKAGTVNVLSNDALIQQGVWLADKKATVNVGAGTYNESIVIDRRGITLKGANAGTAGWNGSRGPETIVTGGSPAFVVAANNVTIDGFTMDGPGLTYGVYLDDVRDTKIKNNLIRNTTIAAIGGIVDHHTNPGTIAIRRNFIDGSNLNDGIALVGDSAGVNGEQTLVGVDIKIINNRIGEGGDAVGGRGIDFGDVGDADGSIEGAGGADLAASIEIAKNEIYSTSDAIKFLETAGGETTILIGGEDRGNILHSARADGVQFESDVSGQTLIEISHNDIDAHDDGIVFEGKTSNVVSGHNEEILISYNTIDARGNGVVFEDESGGGGHNIVIRDNSSIRGTGNGSHGISHVGGLNGTQFRVFRNGAIMGREDGIHVAGVFTGGSPSNTGGSMIEVHQNADIVGQNDDGIAINNLGPQAMMRVSVSNNAVRDSGGDGIYIRNIRADAGSGVSHNTIENVGGDGVHLNNVHRGSAFGNTISNVGEHGVHVASSDIAQVAQNTISDVARDGVHVQGGEDINVNANTINRTGDNGIDVDGNYDGYIAYNTITDTGLSSADGDAIEIADSRSFQIKNNIITNAGDDGIDVKRSNGVLIDSNIITGAGEDGIDVADENAATIFGNEIYDTAGHAIELTNSVRTEILDNIIKRTGGKGIVVSRSDRVEVVGNMIEKTGLSGPDGHGIEILNTFGASIYDNTLRFTGGNGIDLQASTDARIKANDIRYSSKDGVHANQSANAVIADNYLNGISGDAVSLSDSENSRVQDNNLVLINGDAVRAERSDDSVIEGNTIGIVFGEGIHVIDSAEVEVVDNKILAVFGNGILIEDSIDTIIQGNNIEHASESGIELRNSHESAILNNVISDSGEIGFHAAGAANGEIVLTGNQFTDNPVHAKFESGEIDLTNIDPVTGFGNEFTGGDVALQFSPAGGDSSVLALVDNDGPGFQTFESTGGLQPTNYGGTIGEQFFDGQSEFFVQLDNNAFTTPGGDHIWMNGLDSTYVTGLGEIRPADTDGVLTEGQFNVLEGFFDHFPDNGTTGIFSFGFVPEIEQERLFNLFGEFNGGVAGLNITVTGLPLIGAAPPLAGAPSPLTLANIEPAAGGYDGVAVVNPQDIEPAAGGQTVGCWGDAVSAAGAGGVVNLSWGGSFEDSLAAASSCGSETF
jgi:parallel beta-helix repeat protein